MIGVPFIKDLFFSVLKNDLIIKGSFFLCPKWASEMNNPNIEEQLAIGQELTPGEKYPCVLMMPPRKISSGFQFDANDGGTPSIGMDKYVIKLLFVTGAQNTGQNQVSEPNGMSMSGHTIVDTWHDMDRCACDFMKVLFGVTNLATQDFIIDESSIQDILYVTSIGDDNVSGCLLAFNVLLNGGCNIETYPSDWKIAITIPDSTIDSHPFHEVGI